MKRSLAFSLTVALIVMVAHRLPAPIQEVPESPTPAPQQSTKPKPKRTVEPKASENSERSAKGPKSSQPQSEAASNLKPFNIPQSQMTASATSQHSGNEASKAIDGKFNSIWHTPWGIFGPAVHASVNHVETPRNLQNQHAPLSSTPRRRARRSKWQHCNLQSLCEH